MNAITSTNERNTKEFEFLFREQVKPCNDAVFDRSVYLKILNVSYCTKFSLDFL